jgi:hypothetical protein
MGRKKKVEVTETQQSTKRNRKEPKPGTLSPKALVQTLNLKAIYPPFDYAAQARAAKSAEASRAAWERHLATFGRQHAGDDPRRSQLPPP